MIDQNTTRPRSLPLLRSHTPSFLYGSAVLLTCIWILTLAVFPSQDGPLHLYYVNVFRQLLAHRPGLYSDTYQIRNLLPPYSTYYYGLIALGSLVSLETADKLFACICVLLFATGVRILLRAAGVQSAWAILLALPLLLNWPLLMGFASYVCAVGLGCFALAAWCAAARQASWRARVFFLLLIVAIVLTHPIPWLVVVGFAFFELVLRAILCPGGLVKSAGEPAWIAWFADAVTALLACTPYFYLARYKAATTQNLDSVDTATGHQIANARLSFSQQVQTQWFDLHHTRGLNVFDGVGLSRFYRMGIQIVLLGALVLAVAYAVRRKGPAAQAYMSVVWLLFSFVLGLSLIVIPNDLGGGYFFATRLQILFFVSCIVAAGFAFQQMPRFAIPLALFAFLMSLYTLGLGLRFIRPVAKEIATLRDAPVIAADGQPGLAMRTPGLLYPPHLTFYSFYWAPVHYFRWHNLLLFNTAWLGDPIIPVRPRANRLMDLDGTFYNESPQFRSRLMPDEAAARAILGRVAFTVFTRDPGPVYQSPFAEKLGQPNSGVYAANWTCLHGTNNVWYLCQPIPR